MLFQTQTFQRTNIFQGISMKFPPLLQQQFQMLNSQHFLLQAIKSKENIFVVVRKNVMTNFQHFMGPLNKWGFVQAIAHTKGNLLPQNIVDSTLLEHVHENEETFFSSSCKIFGLKTQLTENSSKIASQRLKMKVAEGKRGERRGRPETFRCKIFLCSEQ